MIAKDNNVTLVLRLFDTTHVVETPIGVYENVPVSQLNTKSVITDIRKAFNASLKKLELDITSYKKGEEVE